MTKIVQAVSGMPYKCTHPDCNKSFSNQGLLTRHMRIHTGEKPFACEICGKQFSQRGNLSKHLLSHENAHLRWNRETNFKPFKCPYPNCGKSFTAKLNLQNHVAVHHQHEVAMECGGIVNTNTTQTNIKSNTNNITNNNTTNNDTSIINTSNTTSNTANTTSNTTACLHTGCNLTFTSETELREHIFRTTPGVVEEFNFLREMALKFATVVSEWETMSTQEQASMRLFARSAVRAVQSIPVATTGSSYSGNNNNTSTNGISTHNNVISESSQSGSVCHAQVYNKYIHSSGRGNVEVVAVTCGNADCSCAEEYTHNTTDTTDTTNTVNSSVVHNTNTHQTNTNNTHTTNTHHTNTTNTHHTNTNTSDTTSYASEGEEDGWSDLGSIIDDLTSPHHHTTDCVDGGCVPYTTHAPHNTHTQYNNMYGSGYMHNYSQNNTTYTNSMHTNNVHHTSYNSNIHNAHANNTTHTYAVDDSVLYSPLLFAHDKIATGWEQHHLPQYTNNTVNTTANIVDTSNTGNNNNTTNIVSNISTSSVNVPVATSVSVIPVSPVNTSTSGSMSSVNSSMVGTSVDVSAKRFPFPTSTNANTSTTNSNTNTTSSTNNMNSTTGSNNTSTANNTTNNTTYSCCPGHRRKSFDIDFTSNNNNNTTSSNTNSTSNTNNTSGYSGSNTSSVKKQKL